MKKLLVALMIVGLSAGAAQASILGNLLTFDGSIDTLNDNSLSVMVDKDGDDLLGTGDILYGIYEVEKVNTTSDPSPGGIMGIFSVEITGQVGTIFSHKPTTAATDATLNVKALLDDLLEPGAFNRIPGAAWDDVGIALLEIGILSTNAGADSAVNPFDAAHTEASADLIITSTMTSANGWSLDALLGYDVAETDPAKKDFFQTRLFFNVDTDGDGVPDAVVGDPNGNGVNDEISEISASTNGKTVALECMGLSMIHDVFGSSVSFLPVTVTDFFNANSDHDVVMKPDGSIQMDDGTLISQWDLKDDGNFQINAVPEPSSIAVWGFFGIVALLGAARRFRKNG